MPLLRTGGENVLTLLVFTWALFRSERAQNP